MVEITKSDLGRRVEVIGGWVGTLVGKSRKGYIIECNDPDCYDVSDEVLEWGRLSSNCRRLASLRDFKFIDQPKESPQAPGFKFNIGDIVVLNNRGHQGQNLELWDGPHTACKSDNAFAFESGAKIINRGYYPKEGRNWYQIEHKGKTYANWISEDGLELFVAKPAELSYTYKVGDVIRFKDTPNTRTFRNGASIGKIYTITSFEVKDIDEVERGVRTVWVTSDNKWGTNFIKGDIELVSGVKYDTWHGDVIGTEESTIERLMPSEELPSNMYKALLTPEEVLERYGVDTKPPASDIVYISKQKTKHKLLTF